MAIKPYFLEWLNNFATDCRSLKSSSIKQYLNIIGILHKEFGMANPILDNWHLGSLGVKRRFAGW